MKKTILYLSMLVVFLCACSTASPTATPAPTTAPTAAPTIAPTAAPTMATTMAAMDMPTMDPKAPTPAGFSMMVSDAYVRLAPPTNGMTNAAGYLTLKNNGPDDALMGVQTDAVKSIMLHKTTITNGVASMDMVMSVDVPANSTLELKPGSYHLMMSGASKDGKELTAGQTISLTLLFKSGGKVTVDVVVKGIE